MRAVLTAQPEIDGVWVGGLEMGVSVINAFKEASRTIPFIAGTNPINGFLRLAIENNLEFSAAPFPPASSKLCVETMFKVLRGEPVKRYIDVADVIPGTKPYATDQAKAQYKPQFNDDWIGPAVIPDDAYFEAGFKR
jgi:ABC-type sugar transport system substrate-binding protein